MKTISMFELLYPTFKIDKPIRLIELFAGVGSQAMALRNLGAEFEHHKVVEFDKFAIESYNAIHDTEFRTTDITEIKGRDLEITDTDIYIYILTYSFPCQDLSVAGRMEGMSRNSGTRSGLLWEVERLLNEVEELPQVLLMENVPQVISDQNIEDFQLWSKFLENKGYMNYTDTLNAKDYGVAQNRNRTFMVSLLGEYNYSFPRTKPLEKTIKDYLEEMVDEKYYTNNEKAQSLIEQLIDSGQLKDDINYGDGSVNEPRIKEISNCITAKDRGISNHKSVGGVVVEMNNEVKQVGNIMDSGSWENPQAGRIYSTGGICPTLNTMQGGGREPKIIEPIIVASRGRNKENPSDRTSGAKVEQRLEPNSQGLCNTLTSVQKDNLLLIPTVKVKQATREGYIECEIGGVADLSYPESKTRRGRVQENGDICPTLTASETGVHKIESPYRIRKLTPLECWRLMGFTDEDFYKAEKVNSNTQLYKQAGNSIVVNVLEGIFKQML